MLTKFAETTSLFEIICLVNAEIANRFTGLENEKQMPTSTFTLTKRLILRPKNQN